MNVARLVGWVLAGVGAGGVFFALLRATVRLYVGHRWPLGVALHLGRWAVLAALLVLAARAGALPLLLAAGGTLAARLGLVRPPGAETS